MNILILAYASEPGAGSEYGVGWMVPTTMALRHPECEVYVVTRSRCREKIELALGDKLDVKYNGIEARGASYPNLHFLFYDIPSWMFYKNEMKSHWGEQINYLSWQMLVRNKVKKWCQELDIDVVHHLTFNQYRTPSPGFWLDVPFVMGPIGGAEVIAPAFWQDLDEHTRRKEEIRLKGKDLKVFGWLNSRSKNKKLILCSCGENHKRLKPYVKDSGIEILPAIAYDPKDFEGIIEEDSKSDKSFEMIYAGKAWDWKGILIFLKAVRRMIDEVSESNDVNVKLIGIRFEDEQKRVMGWVKELGLEKYVELIPFIQRSELLRKMTTCSLSVYPAFRDSGSMSVLEACALGCPSICFDAGGQDVFPNDILVKIPVSETYDECLNTFAEKLVWAYGHRDELKSIGLRSQKWVEENLVWDKKVDEFVEIYEGLVK